MNLLVTNDDGIDSVVHAEFVDRGFGCPTWVVDGTPSDPVNIVDALQLGHD